MVGAAFFGSGRGYYLRHPYARPSAYVPALPRLSHRIATVARSIWLGRPRHLLRRKRGSIL
jgi:hypothetical protein